MKRLVSAGSRGKPQVRRCGKVQESCGWRNRESNWPHWKNWSWPWKNSARKKSGPSHLQVLKWPNVCLHSDQLTPHKLLFNGEFGKRDIRHPPVMKHSLLNWRVVFVLKFSYLEFPGGLAVKDPVLSLVVQVWSLAHELLNAVGVAKNKRKFSYLPCSNLSLILANLPRNQICRNWMGCFLN